MNAIGKMFTALLDMLKSKFFWRFLILASLVSISVMLILNVGCGYKDGSFYFDWKPADVKIEYSK
jgi:hypothetical protein